MTATPLADEWQQKRAKLEVAKRAAEKAIEDVLYAQLALLPNSGPETAHIRSRWMQPGGVLNRVLSVTLLDRLELNRWE